MEPSVRNRKWLPTKGLCPFAMCIGAGESVCTWKPKHRNRCTCAVQCSSWMVHVSSILFGALYFVDESMRIILTLIVFLIFVECVRVWLGRKDKSHTKKSIKGHVACSVVSLVRIFVNCRSIMPIQGLIHDRSYRFTRFLLLRFFCFVHCPNAIIGKCVSLTLDDLVCGNRYTQQIQPAKFGTKSERARSKERKQTLRSQLRNFI